MFIRLRLNFAEQEGRAYFKTPQRPTHRKHRLGGQREACHPVARNDRYKCRQRPTGCPAERSSSSQVRRLL